MSIANIPAFRYLPNDERYARVFAWLGPVTGAEFYGVYNELLAVLRNYGSVGPMGEFSLEDCQPSSLGHQGPVVDRRPEFFVVSDWYNERQRWHRVETEIATVKAGLFFAVMSLLQRREGWEVYFALGKGGLLVSADKVEFEGEFFEGCCDLQEIEARCGLKRAS